LAWLIPSNLVPPTIRTVYGRIDIIGGSLVIPLVGDKGRISDRDESF